MIKLNSFSKILSILPYFKTVNFYLSIFDQMSQRSQRLLKIYSLLKTGPVSIDTMTQLAEKNDFNISRRTLYRDLNELENALTLQNERLVVKTGEKNKKIWKIEYNTSDDSLNEFDIYSYLLFKNFMTLPVLTSRKTTMDKIEKLLYETHSKSRFEDFSGHAERQIVSSHFYEVNFKDIYLKILDQCIWCIQNNRELEICEFEFDYTSLGDDIVFPCTILPLQIMYHRGVVHLVGFIKYNHKFVIVGLEQIKDYKLTNNMFDRNTLLNQMDDHLMRRFGVTENMTNDIYNIEIEFTVKTGTFIKNLFWHPTQKFKTLESRNLLFSMTCGINRELVGWIFQWMSNAKVIKPEILRTMVTNKFKEVLEIYSEDKILVSNNSFRI
ncbi:helix-turn-helix transcriptional regulator [Halpernia frigidisoli]|uniref:Predicted DNA-binding transcriptional regulator YafY, contains an HTH and WYL domains n=1 Tax=Halpernia frigidisoli TaxID=1125876 RepID=A0A1I3HU67_9FLAO|nr:WYL domain-containing transcriptional regulator [Halpernia frigidisoli]SFI39318.1 Predicted DNA-binding transcriptional regulator YafY, contains an HTH and WYL domains [Halpernia frigidisoli]